MVNDDICGRIKITVAENAGFCFGVRRAVAMATEYAEKNGRIYAPEQLIHNKAVIEELGEKGVITVGKDNIPGGEAIIIRAHGVSPEVKDELLKISGGKLLDATCPCVAGIHRIVSERSAAGDDIYIFGDADHPEVKGIVPEAAGFVCVIGEDSEVPVRLFDDTKSRTIVAQTTADAKKWNILKNNLKKVCTNVKIFDTICFATEKRQNEAAELAGRCDSVVVIGDNNSANTKRLAHICGELNGKMLRIGTAEEVTTAISEGFFKGCDNIGITAGASVPDSVIKEVEKVMSEELNTPVVGEESFAEMLENSIKTLHTGERVTGVVTNITSTEVHVDLGTKHAGFIPFSEMTDDPSVKVTDIVKIGDEIEVFVGKVSDAEGTVMLSKKKVDSIKAWEDLENAVDDRVIVEGIVTEDNKGGVIVTANGIKIFVPASQTGLPRDAAMSELLQKKVKVRISEVNRSRRRVRGSIRAAQAAERKSLADAVWAGIEVGKKYKGTVKSITPYGAFVDIGGVDGMVHITELSWSRIKSPADVVSIGDELEVYVIGFDTEKKKISLGYKDPGVNPWQVFISKYSVGDTTEVKIVKNMPFGAFAEIVPGVDGLIHISQISDKRIARPADVIEEGQIVNVKILDIDEEKKKISLSMRQAMMSDAEEADAEASDGETEE